MASLGGMFGMGQLHRPVLTCLGLKCGRAWRQFLKWDAAADLSWGRVAVERNQIFK